MRERERRGSIERPGSNERERRGSIERPRSNEREGGA